MAVAQRTYMPEDHIIGHGGSLGFCDTENGTYLLVRGTREVNLPERELGEAETTNDDSPDFHKENTPGMYDPGTVTASCVYQPTQFADIEELFQLSSAAGTRANATKYWKHTLPDGSVAAFRGWVKRNDMPREQEGEMVFEFEIRVVGKMTFTKPAGS